MTTRDLLLLWAQQMNEETLEIFGVWSGENNNVFNWTK
jgi:hypothetical protein